MRREGVELNVSQLDYQSMKDTFTLGKYLESDVGTPGFHHPMVHKDEKVAARFEIPYKLKSSPLKKSTDQNGKNTYSLHANIFPNNAKRGRDGSMDPYHITQNGKKLREFLENFDQLYADLMDAPQNEDVKRKALMRIGLIGPALNKAMKKSIKDYITSKVEIQCDETGMTEIKSPTFSTKLWTSPLTDAHEEKRDKKMVLLNGLPGKKDEIVWTDIQKHDATKTGGYEINQLKKEEDLEPYVYTKGGGQTYFDMYILATLTLPTFYGSKAKTGINAIYKLHMLLIDKKVERQSMQGITREKAFIYHQRLMEKTEMDEEEGEDDYLDYGPSQSPEEPAKKKIKYREVSVPFRCGNEGPPDPNVSPSVSSEDSEESQ